MTGHNTLRRRLATIVAAFLVAFATHESLTAQSETLPFAGTWKLEPSGSDNLPDDPTVKASDTTRGDRSGQQSQRGAGLGRVAATALVRQLTGGDELLRITGTRANVAIRNASGQVSQLEAAARPVKVSLGPHSVDRFVSWSSDRLIDRMVMAEGWIVTRTFSRPSRGQLLITLEATGRGGTTALVLRRVYDLQRQ